MADINTLLENILTAVYGEDVRQSIHDAIQAINNDVSTVATDVPLLLEATRNLVASLGKPFSAASAGQMTDHDKIYVYTGTEIGMINGNWYYYDGTTWVSGGPYNATVDFAIGSGTGTNSIIENDIGNNLATGNSSHAEGFTTQANGYASHAEGYDSEVSGAAAHVEGYHNEATGNYSHAEGYNTIANGQSQHVSGEFNAPDSSSLEIIGNGTSDEDRSNARTLSREGVEWLADSLEIGETREKLTASKVKEIESFSAFLQSVRETSQVSGPEVTISDGSEAMPLQDMIINIYPEQDEETGDISGFSDESIHVNDFEYYTEFTTTSGIVYGGVYRPISGILTVTMIGSVAQWGDMTFSIDPDNYIGKRISLPGCLSGEDGNNENSLCNMTDNYLYDQSASTHFYIYKDEEDPGYAVVVLPDDTPDETIIKVVGTLEEPVEYSLPALNIKTVRGENIISVSTGEIDTLTYYKDSVAEDIDILRELIEEGYDLDTNFTVADRAKLESIEEGAEVNQHAFTTIKAGSGTVEADSSEDILTFKSTQGGTITIDPETKTVDISFKFGVIYSDDYKQIEHPYVYPSGLLFPGNTSYSSNGRIIISGFGIDLQKGVIYGGFYTEQINDLEARVEALEEREA